jgi:hypothetical protein
MLSNEVYNCRPATILSNSEDLEGNVKQVVTRQ